MKKLNSLKYRIIFCVVMILGIGLASIVIFENIAEKAKSEFSDKSMTVVFDNVRKDNEKFHIKQTGEELQDLAGSDEVIDFLSGNRNESNLQVLSGLFITLSEATQARKIVLLDNGFNIAYAEKTNTSLAGDALFLNNDIRSVYKQAGETWENQGFTADSDGNVVFVVVTAVINDDDEVVGFAACELPIAKLAASFSKTVKGKIGFQGKNDTFCGACDDEFFKQIPKDLIKTAESGTGIIFKWPGPVKGEHSSQTSDPSRDKGAGPVFYKLYPVFVKDISGSSYRYWVSLKYTAAAQVENRLSLLEPVVIAGVMVLGVLGLFFLLTIQIKPLEYVVTALKDIAQGEGDLTRRIQVDVQNEIGELAHWFNRFVERLNQIVLEIGEDAAVVSGSSGDLLSISRKLDKSSNDLSSRSDSAAAVSEQMSVSMNSVAAASEQASVNLDSVASAAGVMRFGLDKVSQNCNKARAISEQASSQVESASSRVGQLGDSAKDIGKVVEVITAIAEQTNLLALNATIEAARAGEAGRGFAVVADEIKVLAGQTARATLEIREKITGIQNSTGDTVGDVGKITDIIAEVSTIVTKISGAIDEQSNAASQVADNIEQASAGIGEVNENIAQSSQASTEISADVAGVNTIAADISQGSTDMSHSAEKLSELAARLRDRVGVFKV